MCYPKPGPRCSSHAKETMQKAAVAVFSTLNSVQLEAYNGNEALVLQAQLDRQLAMQNQQLQKINHLASETANLHALALALTSKKVTHVGNEDHALIMTALNQDGITSANATERFNGFLAQAPQDKINSYAQEFGIQSNVARELYAIKFAVQINERKTQIEKDNFNKDTVSYTQKLSHEILAKKVATVRRMADSQIRTANPKLGEFNKAEKEYHLTSGYRSVLRDEANRARERGNFRTSNLLLNEAAKLDSEYEYKYGAWLAIHRKGLDAIL